jgi:hypothetical protein
MPRDFVTSSTAAAQVAALVLFAAPAPLGAQAAARSGGKH